MDILTAMIWRHVHNFFDYENNEDAINPLVHFYVNFYCVIPEPYVDRHKGTAASDSQSGSSTIFIVYLQNIDCQSVNHRFLFCPIQAIFRHSIAFNNINIV